MRYALLVYNDPEVDLRGDEEQRRVTAGIYEVLARPDITGWLRLRNTESATTVRYERGRTLLTDGPFVAIKEALGGYLFFEADDLDAAVELAARIPAARLGGAVEIRPVVER